MSGKRVAKDIREWLDEYKSYQPNDFEMTYDDWMNRAFHKMDPEITNAFFSKLDTWLFHTHAFLQGSSFQNDARGRVLKIGRIFDGDIENIPDMRNLTIEQLTYITEQQVAKGRLYSFTQGGLTGTGGWLMLGIDFPLMMVLNLRVVQLIGLTFGHEMNHPHEMMVSLKVFHAATLPKRLQAGAWRELVKEIDDHEHPYIFNGNDKLTNERWLEQPIKQSFKSLFILMFRKKLFQGIPFISIAIGAYSNYQLTKQVTDFAVKFYQYRHLLYEKSGR